MTLIRLVLILHMTLIRVVIILYMALIRFDIILYIALIRFVIILYMVLIRFVIILYMLLIRLVLILCMVLIRLVIILFMALVRFGLYQGVPKMWTVLIAEKNESTRSQAADMNSSDGNNFSTATTCTWFHRRRSHGWPSKHPCLTFLCEDRIFNYCFISVRRRPHAYNTMVVQCWVRDSC